MWVVIEKLVNDMRVSFRKIGYSIIEIDTRVACGRLTYGTQVVIRKLTYSR